MALRLLEGYFPDADWNDVLDAANDRYFLDSWSQRQDDGRLFARILAFSEDSGLLIDQLQEAFGEREGFRLNISAVATSVPRPKSLEERAREKGEELEVGEDEAKRRAKLSREELRSAIWEQAEPTKAYFVMMGVASVVAGIGVLRDNDAAVIGAMVIAPLLGPNVALALATTLADWKLAGRALKSLVLGVGWALAFSAAWGALAQVRPELAGVAPRARVALSDVVLAMAAGCAGVLSFTMGASAQLVGVMVAAALLPSLVTCGLLLGAFHFEAAAGAGLVFAANIICVNLCGIATFLVQGIRPRNWWEAERARRASFAALGLWAALLAILVAIIQFAPIHPGEDGPDSSDKAQTVSAAKAGDSRAG